MPHHELDAASVAIAAAISVATLIVNADARAVRAAAPESIQSLGEEPPTRDDIDVDPDWDPLPSSCAVAGRLGATYFNCDGVWYEPRFAGASITYVVVNPPRQITSSLYDNRAPQIRRER